MSNILQTANQIIDQNAHQLLPLLPLDRNSATLLINEILNEKDFNEKLSKILHLLMDKMKAHTLNSNTYLDELISSLKFLYPSIPNNPVDFSNWIKQKLIESSENESKFKEAEIYFQHKLQECQKHLETAKKLVEDYELRQSNSYEENNIIRQQLKKEIEINQSLKLQINSLKSFSNDCYKTLDNDIQENAKISSLQQKINLLQNKIAEQKSIINTLKAKISIDSNEIEECKKQNQELCTTSQNDQIKNAKIEELIQINQKLKKKIKKQKEKIILLRDKGNAKINKYKMKIEEQKRKIDYDNDPLQNDNLNLLEKCELLTTQLDKSNQLIKKYETEKSYSSNVHLKTQKNKINKKNELLSEERRIINQIDIDFDEMKDIEKQQTIECNGCDFDVDNLKGRFENLENSIDKLRSALIKPKQ